jgi:hypothetical protein
VRGGELAGEAIQAGTSALAVFLFFDESGNLDFSRNGTKYYVFGALTTRDPAALLRPLSDLRYRLIAQGMDLEAFHASEDRQVVRDEVFDVLSTCGGFEFDAVIVEKRKVNPVLHDQVRFYVQFADYLLSYVFRRHSDPNDRIVVLTGRLPVKRKKQAVEKVFKSYIRQNLGGRPFNVLHHSMGSHACLQAADYCTWAVYKKWKDGETRPYDLIRPFVISEFDILRRGTEYFY